MGNGDCDKSFDFRRRRAAATHRQDDQIGRTAKLTEDFHGNACLTFDHIRIIEGRKKMGTGLRTGLRSSRFSQISASCCWHR